MSRPRASPVWAVLSIATVAVALFGALTARHRRVEERLVDAYRADEHEQTLATVQEIEATLRPIYAGLRTMSRLPSVRAALGSGAALDPNDRVTVQELYNNLASAVEMSEVYLVPADIDPDGLDGGSPAPALTFDALIVGRVAHEAHDDDEATEPIDVEELEIYEYRLMREQIAWLRARAPRDPGSLDELVATGPEVVTCDNSHFDPLRPEDRARAGLVLTVPVYADEGQLVGGVAGVLRTDVLRNLLPVDAHVLRDPAHDLTLAAIGRDPAPFAPWLASGLPDPGALYSEIVPVRFGPGADGWFVWARRPDEAFATRADVSSERRFYLASLAVLAAGTLVAIGWYGSVDRALRAQGEEVARRVAAERNLRGALREAEAATLTKSQFLANMSHELRTPLNAIIGYAELLGESADGADAMDLERILAAARHLLSLINDVLDLSKIEAGRMLLEEQWFDVRPLIDEVVATAAPLVTGNGSQFVLDLAPDLGGIHADPLRIKQVLLNLLSNAAKFTRQGRVTLRAHRVEGAIVCAVEDTGVGMSGEQLANLFQPFVQGDLSTSRKFGGTGLGLALSRRFAEMMGATIEVRSAAGAGSTFTFTVPIAPTPLSVPNPTELSSASVAGA